jgi:hypothetical protein
MCVCTSPGARVCVQVSVRPGTSRRTDSPMHALALRKRLVRASCALCRFVRRVRSVVCVSLKSVVCMYIRIYT